LERRARVYRALAVLSVELLPSVGVRIGQEDVCDDLVAAYYSTGIRTFTSSIATVAPLLSLKLHELAENGEQELLSELLDRCVIPLYAIRARRRGYEVSTMKVMMDMV